MKRSYHQKNICNNCFIVFFVITMTKLFNRLFHISHISLFKLELNSKLLKTFQFNKNKLSVHNHLLNYFFWINANQIFWKKLTNIFTWKDFSIYKKPLVSIYCRSGCIFNVLNEKFDYAKKNPFASLLLC